MGSSDNGTWRRLRPVEFKGRIPEGSGITNYADLLVKEAGAAILSWMIHGAVNFAANSYKLDIPRTVTASADEYRRREDWLENFLAERCVVEAGAAVRAGELYRCYRDWALGCGDYVRRTTDFNAAMEARGFISRAPQNKKSWHGLRLDYHFVYAASG